MRIDHDRLLVVESRSNEDISAPLLGRRSVGSPSVSPIRPSGEPFYFPSARLLSTSTVICHAARPRLRSSAAGSGARPRNACHSSSGGRAFRRRRRCGAAAARPARDRTRRRSPRTPRTRRRRAPPTRDSCNSRPNSSRRRRCAGNAERRGEATMAAGMPSAFSPSASSARTSTLPASVSACAFMSVKPEARNSSVACACP